VAAVAGPGLCKNGDRPMSKTPRPRITSVERSKVPAPVRVKLRRLNCDHAIPYPPDGHAREWWHRLKNAFGTASSAFVQASLYQLIAAARLPNSGISEIAVNASLAFIEAPSRRERSKALSSSKWPAPMPHQWPCLPRLPAPTPIEIWSLERPPQPA
jgi:hypothetical protein